MMMRNSILNLALKASMILLMAFVASCKKDKAEEPETPEFDRKTMLQNTGNNIIIPAYLDFKNKAEELDAAVSKFISAPDLPALSALQDAVKEAYLSWQNASVFEFGPAEQILLRVNTNTFPADTVQIASNISSGTYDLSTVNNLDAKGLPAMDYILFGTGTDNNAILDKYISDANAGRRKTYLKDISSDMKAKISSVYNSWISSGGNYISTFINNTGSSVGSSLGLLVNQVNFDFEILKNYRIGIPLGKKTLGTPLPEKAEAYYAGNSVELAIEHIKAIERIYLGKSRQGNDGSGLDDYLVHLQSKYNGGLLSDAIKSQLTSATAKLQSIPGPLSQMVVSNPSVVDAAYIELQKQVVLFKTDMPSALGVLITYQDNDGD